MRRRAAIGLAAAVLGVPGCVSISDDERLDESGEIEIVIDGEPLDLSADRFQAEHAEDSSLAFHLHDSDDRWHMEGEERVTVATGLDLLPHIACTVEGGDVVLTIDERTYDERDPDTEITVAIDGEEIDPAEYRLQDGDAIRVEVRTDE